MRPIFDVQRIHYRWYGEHQSYLLITIGSTGAVAELWRRFITKKGNIMNEPIAQKTETPNEAMVRQEANKEETLEQIMEKVIQKPNKEVK